MPLTMARILHATVIRSPRKIRGSGMALTGALNWVSASEDNSAPRVPVESRHVSSSDARPSDFFPETRREVPMSHLQCPSCGYRRPAIGAPPHCPRCRLRRGEPVELVPVPMFTGPARADPPGAMRPFRLSEESSWPECLENPDRGRARSRRRRRSREALGRAVDSDHLYVLVDLERCGFSTSARSSSWWSPPSISRARARGF